MRIFAFLTVLAGVLTATPSAASEFFHDVPETGECLTTVGTITSYEVVVDPDCDTLIRDGLSHPYSHYIQTFDVIDECIISVEMTSEPVDGADEITFDWIARGDLACSDYGGNLLAVQSSNATWGDAPVACGSSSDTSLGYGLFDNVISEEAFGFRVDVDDDCVARLLEIDQNGNVETRKCQTAVWQIVDNRASLAPTLACGDDLVITDDLDWTFGRPTPGAYDFFVESPETACQFQTSYSIGVDRAPLTDVETIVISNCDQAYLRFSHTITLQYAITAPEPPTPFEELAARPDLNGAHANILRLYWAAFDREPDVGGAEFWIEAFNDGDWPTLTRIAEHFVVSEEFIETYGETTNAEFVEALYLNILDRPSDPGGRAFWLDDLDAGTRTRGQVLADFSFSQEFRDAHPLPSDDR